LTDNVDYVDRLFDSERAGLITDTARMSLTHNSFVFIL